MHVSSFTEKPTLDSEKCEKEWSKANEPRDRQWERDRSALRRNKRCRAKEINAKKQTNHGFITKSWINFVRLYIF